MTSTLWPANESMSNKESILSITITQIKQEIMNKNEKFIITIIVNWVAAVVP